MEASLDTDFGLKASQRYCFAAGECFLPVQGNLEHPPLQAGALGLAVFNASLHYARDLDGTLHRAARALRHGGCLVILDTPIANRPRPGTGKGDRHLGRKELAAALAAAGLNARWVAVRRSWRWWFYQVRAGLKQSPRFSFPIVLGFPQVSTD